MKSFLQVFFMLLAMLMPTVASAEYEKLAEGVYQDGTTLYICSNVTSLEDLQINPSVIYCYATIPPACVSNTFTGYDATLHVPAAGMVSYFSAQYWNYFNNILSDAIEPQQVTINEAEAEIEIGQQLSLYASVAPGDATPKTIYWSSTDPTIATVNGGSVIALAAGECDILATCLDKVAMCHVTVMIPSVTITIDKHVARLLPNHTLTITATSSPVSVNLAVTSSNPEVALARLVNGTIMVVGVSEGTATVTVNAATGNGIPDSCVVTVYTEHGDVNSDGYVNISDVTALIDYLLSGNPSGISLSGADCNNDSSINISDVTTLIDFLLSGEWPFPQTQTFNVNGVSFTMVKVSGGTFIMGARDDDTQAQPYEKPLHQVTLSSFSIGETEVTQALWLAVMGSNPSSFKDDLNRPVNRISRADCKAFISKLNEMTGEQFRLPTEAEWEFAARGGNKSKGYKYAGSNTIDDVAWYSLNSDSKAHPVGTKAPNELGLYDMSGNIYEFCQDYYGSYSDAAQINPTGPTSGSQYVRRGGSWSSPNMYCRVSSRMNISFYTEESYNGLRLAL